MLTIKSNTEDELARIASALENINGGSTANVGGGVLVQLSPIAGSSGEYEISDYTAAELYAMCMSRPVTFLKHEYVPENMVPGATNVIMFQLANIVHIPEDATIPSGLEDLYPNMYGFSLIQVLDDQPSIINLFASSPEEHPATNAQSHNDEGGNDGQTK